MRASFRIAFLLATAVAVPSLGAETAFNLEPGTRVLPPIVYGQLAVFPIVKSDAAPGDRNQYLTLSVGLKEKLVQVTEETDGAQVNQVTVANKSKKPLLLLGGEVILGGQQDRIIGQDTILEAGRSRSIEVFCVEHGRWSGAQAFSASGGMAEGRVRMSAKFKQDQGAVWNEVAERNASLGAESATGTYRHLATGAEGAKAIQPYKENITAALEKLPDAKKIVGLATALNGRIVSVDVFATPALFDAYRDGLLQSSYVSAAAAPSEPKAPPAPAAAAVGEFMQHADAAPEQTVAHAGKSRTAMKKGADISRSAVMEKNGDSETQVYRSYQYAH